MTRTGSWVVMGVDPHKRIDAVVVFDEAGGGALRIGHSPDPSGSTIRPAPTSQRRVPRLDPDALEPRRPAGIVKRGLLDHAEDRRTIKPSRDDQPLDAEGCQYRSDLTEVFRLYFTAEAVGQCRLSGGMDDVVHEVASITSPRRFSARQQRA